MLMGKENKRIFTFWEPKKSIPAYIELCIDTWRKFLPEYEIIIVDYSNLAEYIGDFYDKSLYTNFSLAKQADAIRAALLSKYGGLWLDADTIVTSYKARSFLNNQSYFSMVGRHIAFIKADTKSYIVQQWAQRAKERILIYKKAKEQNLNNKDYEVYYFLGNGCINDNIEKIVKEGNIDEFTEFDRRSTGIIMEALYDYKNNISKNAIQSYVDFYFNNDYSDFLMENEGGLLLLHNSWTPPQYKTMSKEDFLQQKNTLAVFFNKIFQEERKMPYFITTKNDGNSSSLLNLLQTMYIAYKATGKDNFKFIWNPLSNAEPDLYKKFQDRNILMPTIDDKNNIFSADFIEKYFIEVAPKNNKMIGDSEIVSFVNGKASFAEADFYCVTSKNLSNALKNYKNQYTLYRKEMKQIWKNIQFSDSVKEVIELAKKQAKKLKNFIAIQVRSGDGVYIPSIYRKTKSFEEYVTTCEHAIFLIEENPDKQILVFGDDINSIEEALKVCNKKNAIPISSIYRKISDSYKKFSDFEKYIFDVTIIAESEIIYYTSGVPQVSYFINDNVTLINNYSVGTISKRYETSVKYFPLLKLNASQKAFSLLHLFKMALSLNLDIAIAINYLHQALEYDYDNDKYRIYIVDTYGKNNETDKAENYLSETLKTRDKQFVETLLFRTYWTGINFLRLFNFYLDTASENYPYISFVAAKICEFQGDIAKAFQFCQYSFKAIFIHNIISSPARIPGVNPPALEKTPFGITTAEVHTGDKNVFAYSSK